MSELRRLQLLVELDRLGTIAAVAAATTYSTSGISQQLAALERDLGVALLEPDGRRVKLTAAGRALVARAPYLLDRWEEARGAVRAEIGSVGGVLRLAVFQSAYLALVPDLLRRVEQQYPELVVQVLQAEPEQAVPQLLARELDAAVVEQYPGTAMRPGLELRYDTLLSDPLLLAVPAEGARTRPELWELRDRDWVVEARGSAARGWVETTCRAAGFEPRVRFETGDMVIQLHLVAAGRAVAFVPALLPETFRSGVATFEEPERRRILHLVTRAASTDPALDALRRAVQGAAGTVG